MAAEVWAVIGRRGEKWTGRMVTARGLDRPCVAFATDQAPSFLELGAQVELGLATRKMTKAARCGAQIESVEWIGEHVEITLDPDEPELFHEAIPGLADQAPERRQNERVFPRSGDGIQVPVRTEEDLGAKPLLARLCDASAGGLGLLFSMGAEERLRFSRVLLCELVTPSGDKREVSCAIRNRRLAVDGVRYGVEFTSDVGSKIMELLPFEPLWDCSCGAAGLLVATHPRCPQCGKPREGSTRLPHRDGLLSAVVHPYIGREQRCKSCGAYWSNAAKFCARCGLKL